LRLVKVALRFGLDLIELYIINLIP